MNMCIHVLHTHIANPLAHIHAHTQSYQGRSLDVDSALHRCVVYAYIIHIYYICITYIYICHIQTYFPSSLSLSLSLTHTHQSHTLDVESVLPRCVRLRRVFSQHFSRQKNHPNHTTKNRETVRDKGRESRGWKGGRGGLCNNDVWHTNSRVESRWVLWCTFQHDSCCKRAIYVC